MITIQLYNIPDSGLVRGHLRLFLLFHIDDPKLPIGFPVHNLLGFVFAVFHKGEHAVGGEV